MKKANEIAVITKKAVQEKMAERHDTTMTYINNTIAKAIERNAKNGDYSLKIKVSESLDRDLIEKNQKLLEDVTLNLDCSNLFVLLQLQPFYRLNSWIQRWDKIVY